MSHTKGRDCARTEEVLENYRRRALAAETKLVQQERQTVTATNATLWKNVQPDSQHEGYAVKGMLKGYEDGDALCNVWEGVVETDPAASWDWDVAERVFAIHNRDDRPTGQICPSASVGDVVQVGDRFFAVDRVGFFEVPVPSSGPANRPRTKIGGQFIARTRDEYLEAEEGARRVAREIAAVKL